MLGVNNLVGFGVGGLAMLAPQYVDNLIINDSQTTNSKSITLPAWTKSAIVTTHVNSNGSNNRTWSSITVDGNAATKMVSIYSGDGEYSSEQAIWGVNGLLGGSVTFAGEKSGDSGSYDSAALLIALNVEFKSFTPDDSATIFDTSNPMSLNCDAFHSGLIVGAWQTNESQTPLVSYLGDLTSVDPGSNQKCCTAWLVPSAESANQLIEAQVVDSFHRTCGFAVASFKRANFKSK